MNNSIAGKSITEQLKKKIKKILNFLINSKKILSRKKKKL